MAQIQRWFLHVDLDAFFASVEQLDHPEYRSKPVIVGGKPEDRRSVVSTASYEARKYGVHSAMPTFQAYKLCPHGIYVHGRMERYAELSYQIMNIFRNYSPDVDQMSIDEAFIDITGTEKLFGPPQETAKKIKEEVLSKVGLTVSIGIAPTKYLAKIASGYQKPNGITFIDQGQEENFMLKLPLNKVWGLGPKSLELINSKGIKTTRDIYEMPIENLQFLFGKNMGTYLYEVVRGNEKATFTRESKNHSISAESTYPYDLTDLYTIETELLELAHGVFFRLLKENGFSRTAFVKIRYDDFSTCSIQETLDRNIITLDRYFETIKRLFEKKYEKGRGIRLLGVGFENIDNEEKPYQQDLFENRDEKKQAVEKAILNLEKKHPEIKVRKARTFKTILFLILFAITPSKVKAEEKNVDNIENTKLFEYNIEGFYKADFQAGFSNNALTTPVFKQEVDILASLFYNNHWYFNTAFADNFEKNTFTVGYKNGEYIKDVKLSNRNILFPKGYSSEIFGYSPMGGQNQAPGISLNLESPDNKWSADFMLRYDMTSTHSATFQGYNKVQDSYINLEDYEKGLSFIFPDDTENYLTDIANIYVENEYGKYIDANGKKYTQLAITEYTLLISKKQLFIYSNANGNSTSSKTPTILITFNSTFAADAIINKTGEYSDTTTFAGKIQQDFKDSFNLSDYSYPLKTYIEEKPALVIQNKVGFSPYLDASIYVDITNTGKSDNAEYYVVSKNSESIIKEFAISSWEDLYNNPSEDLLNGSKKFIQVSSKDSTRFPFINIAPELYLNLPQKNDYSIRVRQYNPVTEFIIGKNIVAGTIQVYKNGILETGFLYDAGKGSVILSSTITNSDKIYISWQEENNSYSNGALTTAAGLKYNINNSLSTDISISAYWPIYTYIDKNYYATPESLNTGYGSFSTGIKYNSPHLYLYDAINFAITKENTANRLLVNSHEKNLENTIYLSENSGYKTTTEPQINTFERHISLQSKNNSTVGNHKGVNDSKFSGYAIPLFWDFSKSDSPWASVDVKLASNILHKNLASFEFLMKTDIPSESFSKYEFYLQLGVNASDNFTGEESKLIPTWKLNLENTTQWQKLSINLTDVERNYIQSGNDARILVLPKSGEIITEKGTLYFGPYNACIQNIILSYPQEATVITNTDHYNSNDYSTVINWHTDSSINISLLNDSNIYAKNYFPVSDYSNYNFISFSFKSSDISNFKYCLKNNDSSSIILEFLDLSDIGTSLSVYHTVKINTNTCEVYIDDKLLSQDKYYLQINKNISPTYQEIIIPLTEAGSFAIGNLIYEDTNIITNAKNYGEAVYSNSFGDFELNAKVSSTQTIGDFSNPEFFINTNGKLQTTWKKLHAETDLCFSNQDLLTAGHLIKTNSPAFNIISVQEDYRFDNANKNLSKSDSLNLDFTSLKIPVKINFQTLAQNSSSTQKQNLLFETSANLKKEDYSGGFSFKAAFNQLEYSFLNSQESWKHDNYFTGWTDISSLQFSNGFVSANERKNDYTGKLNFSIPFGKLSPLLSYNLYGFYQTGNNINFVDKENLTLNIPFSISSYNFSFNLSRTGSGIADYIPGGDYISDSKHLFTLQNERSWFYTAIPFYDLFDNNLKNNVSTNYSTKYETTFKRKLFNSYKDLYIPSSASFTIIRDIKANDTIKDLYQYKLTISNNSINNLGAFSLNKLIKWFDQEEIVSSITGIVKVPANSLDNTTFQISSYLQCLLMISDKAMVSYALNGSFETDLTWNLNNDIYYSRPSKISLIKTITELIIPYVKTMDINISRKDSLNIQLGSIHNKNKQTYSFQHSINHEFLKYYTLSTGISTDINYIENESTFMSFAVNIGFRAEF